MNNTIKKYLISFFIFLIGISSGWYISLMSNTRVNNVTADELRLDDQEATVGAINKVIPAVVSIIISDTENSLVINLKTGQQTKKTEKVRRGSGTGFLISPDGLILTNKHVVNAGTTKSAEYKVILNTGKQYDAKIIGKDPINDLATLKISAKNLPFAELGNSDKLQIGTTVIAIGNTLGRYQNSATKGIVSGLGRSIVASDQAGSNQEGLDNVIQTDAEINPGNSGGPLIDLLGNVVGINVAIDQAGSSIGFAIPANDAKPVVKSVTELGRIVRPRLGVKYLMLTAEIAQTNSLARSSGAWIIPSDDGSASVLAGSPAEAAGLKTNDIIMEINAIKLEGKNTLLSIIQKYKPGSKIGLKIYRNGALFNKIATLDEFK